MAYKRLRAARQTFLITPKDRSKMEEIDFFTASRREVPIVVTQQQREHHRQRLL